MKGIKKILSLLLVVFIVVSNAQALFNTKKDNVLGVALPFLVANEQVTAQLEVLTNTRQANKKRADEVNKLAVKTLNKITEEIAEAQARLKGLHEGAFEYANKKVSLLNTRKQLWMNHQELWRDLIELTEKHIALYKASEEYRTSFHSKPNPVYSWKDFRSAQIKYAEHLDQVELEKRKRETIKKQVLGEKDTLASLQKQLDVKNKEREKLAQIEGAGKLAAHRIMLLKYAAEVFEQEINLLNEKLEFSKVKIEKLGIEEKYKDDEIAFSQNKLTDEKDFLEQIERRLLLDIRDVELAKTEWKNELQKTLQIKEELSKAREVKNFEKEKLNLDLEFIREKIKQMKEKGDKNYVESALAKSNAQKFNAQQQLLDRELLLLDTKKDVADVLAKIKELQYLMIEVRYRLKEERVNFDELLANFKNQREVEQANYKSFKEKRLEAVYSLIENKRAAETAKLKIDKIKTKKAALFKDKETTLQTVITNYNDVRRDLSQLTQITQDFLAACSDLITHQDAVLISYDLIINDLESRKVIQSIWKRSPRAISLKAFMLALAEAEAMSKRFFWDTPANLAPTILMQGLLKTTWNSLLYLLLFLCLFFLFFVGLRYVVNKLHGITAYLITKKVSQTRTLYFNVAHAITLFAKDNFVFLYILIFVYAHIVFQCRYIFCSLKNYATPYNMALFHLVSIPILVYLSVELITQFKELNKRLSYLFFAERFQDRFILLLSLFFYSTAILLPLRAAFLAYNNGGRVLFGDVLFAAYSLFVLVVILLFFSKEDVLTIIPSHNAFCIWLKRKIEKHYYPVFGFVMGLFILSNHSIGYSNLAWYLAVAVPLSITLFYVLFLAHHYVRKYSLLLFMQEDEDEIRDKFEHAKTYYGFFVIVSFLCLLFGTVVILARIWGLDVMPFDLWRLLSESWVIPLGGGNKLGFVQLMELVMFIVGGFLVSSLVHKFILSKLFEILRTEPGLQNTISRMLHYVLISVALLFGLVTIHIDYYFILTVGGMLTVGLGLAMKDVLTDFVGGFLILLERPIEIGNYIQLDQLQGTVHKIAARTTTLVTSRNHSIVIPNRELLTKTFINWGHGRFAVGFEVDVRVRHDTDPDLVKRVLISVLQSNPIVLRVPAIVARLEAFEENSLYFLTRAFISARRVKDQWEIAAQLRMDILKAFKENNIKLAQPHRVLSALSDERTGDGVLAVRFGGEKK